MVTRRVAGSVSMRKAPSGSEASSRSTRTGPAPPPRQSMPGRPRSGAARRGGGGRRPRGPWDVRRSRARLPLPPPMAVSTAVSSHAATARGGRPGRPPGCSASGTARPLDPLAVAGLEKGHEKLDGAPASARWRARGCRRSRRRAERVQETPHLVADPGGVCVARRWSPARRRMRPGRRAARHRGQVDRLRLERVDDVHPGVHEVTDDLVTLPQLWKMTCRPGRCAASQSRR